MALSLKEKAKTILKLIIEPKIVISLISLRAWGYLIDMGWFNSYSSGKPLDKNNQPIPWFTYPANEFLSGRLNKTMKVLEFGSGNSTLFLAQRVNNVLSVEHNKDWYNMISNQISKNSKVVLVGSRNVAEYINPSNMDDQKFDIIIVDGIYRNECCTEAIKFLADSGVILLDDSEREAYQVGIESLMKKGFKRIDFWGISAGYLYKKATTVFYRSNNILQI